MRRGARQDSWITARVCASIALLSLGASGCTEPATRRGPVTFDVRIDADSEVQARVVEVEAYVESRRDGDADWRVQPSRQFHPASILDWPLKFETDPEPQMGTGSVTYQLVARARDSRDAVVAQARVIASAELARRHGLHVLFDRSCLDRTELCGPEKTCSAGDCISAVFDPNAKPRTPSSPGSDGGTDPDARAPSEEGIATEGASCAAEGEMRCAGFGSSQPLRCAEGSWQRHMECTSAQRCDTAAGIGRGTCRTMARECAGQKADVPFCDADSMHVCNADLLTSIVRPCGDNERCVAEKGEARCQCQAGFVKGARGCVQSSTCDVDNGGCDPLTECKESNGTRTCTACPPGFGGMGDTSCIPRLVTLHGDSLELKPAFSPTVTDYHVAVPLLMQRLKLTAAGPAGALLKFNGTAVASGEPWTSPVLTLGTNTVEIQVATEFGGSNTYKLTIERAGAQAAYIKSSNSASGHSFGTFMAVSGDTLVVGAPGEDSAASGVNGDQASTAARDSGAAYVFVRSEAGWKQQAYLKPRVTTAESFFGFGVAISGDTIVVGAMRRDANNITNLATDHGSAYVYTRTDGTWSLQQELTASDAAVGDAFGYAVAVDGDVLVAGSPLLGSIGSKFGAAYVFTRTAGQWTQQQKIESPAPRDLSMFASVLSLGGDTLAIGALEDQTKAYRGGAVFVYTKRSGKFEAPQRLEPQPIQEYAWFGFSSSLDGDRLAIGAPVVDQADRTDEPSGKVFVYQRTGTKWEQSAVVTAPLLQPANFFGTGVSLRGDTLLVGATGESGSSAGVGGDPMQREARASGAAYLYARTDEGWKYSTYVKASNPGSGDSFGWMVALGPNYGVAVAHAEDGAGQGLNPMNDGDASEGSGAAYVFE